MYSNTLSLSLIYSLNHFIVKVYNQRLVYNYSILFLLLLA